MVSDQCVTIFHVVSDCLAHLFEGGNVCLADRRWYAGKTAVWEEKHLMRRASQMSWCKHFSHGQCQTRMIYKIPEQVKAGSLQLAVPGPAASLS